MSSDRNYAEILECRDLSLVDWDMSSDRNLTGHASRGDRSLVDWDMSSDRNHIADDVRKFIKSSRLGYEL